jgi:hypothetical protein
MIRKCGKFLRRPVNNRVKMMGEEIKIVELLRKKGFITNRDSLKKLMILAIEENEKKAEKLKKNSIEILNNQKIMKQDQFLHLLASKLESH